LPARIRSKKGKREDATEKEEDFTGNKELCSDPPGDEGYQQEGGRLKTHSKSQMVWTERKGAMAKELRIGEMETLLK
ncbi:hypothetical protein HAX54_027017, partial [Datura stramonium]|nr:hypothetical protein [Datura stramonium]